MEDVKQLECTKCFVVKPIYEFEKDKGKPLGVKKQCRDCIHFRRYGTKRKAGYSYKSNYLTEKQCTVCDQVKPIEDFNVKKVSDNGDIVWKSWCKECVNVKGREFSARKRSMPRSKPIDQTGVKTCSTCGIEKPRLDFRNKRESNDGKNSQCKDCAAKSARKRINSLEIIEVDFATCPVCNETKPASNFGKDKGRRTGISHRCKSCNAEYKRQPLFDDGSRVKDIIEYRFEIDGHVCAYCGMDASGFKVYRDHIVPVSRGGLNTVQNVVPCCHGCNASKGIKSLAEFAEYQAMCGMPFVPTSHVASVLSMTDDDLVSNGLKRETIFQDNK